MSDAATSFSRSLDHWSMSGGELGAVLSEYSDHVISSVAEVQAISRALDALHATYQDRVESGEHELAKLANYLLSPSDDTVLQAIIAESLPLLRWYVGDALSGKNHDPRDIMTLLFLLARYRQKEDISLVFKALINGFERNSSDWKNILGNFRDNHPFIKPFLQAVSKQLPPNQAGLEFLYLCDHIFTTQQLRPHAYNAEQGLRKLTSYLHPESKRPEEFALAAVHTATLLDVQKRDALLKFSGSHPNPKVVFLTRVTRASLGDLDEQKLLRERCLDLTCSHETQLKLTEVGMESLIPEEAKDPEFLALAKTSHWLIHQSPFGTVADRLELVDSRELFWLPNHEQCRLYAVKYEYDTPQGDTGLTAGIAVVGGITHSLIGETDPEMDLADLYGLHCCWELEERKDPVAPRHRTAKIGRNLLRKNNPDL